MSPVYSYACPKCGTRFEVTKPLRLLARPETCPKCFKASIRTPMPCGLIFKGSGWDNKHHCCKCKGGKK